MNLRLARFMRAEVNGGGTSTRGAAPNDDRSCAMGLAEFRCVSVAPEWLVNGLFMVGPRGLFFQMSVVLHVADNNALRRVDAQWKVTGGGGLESPVAITLVLYLYQGSAFQNPPRTLSVFLSFRYWA